MSLTLSGLDLIASAAARGFGGPAVGPLFYGAGDGDGEAPSQMREVALFDALVGGAMLWRKVVDLGSSNPLANVSPMVTMIFSAMA